MTPVTIDNLVNSTFPKTSIFSKNNFCMLLSKLESPNPLWLEEQEQQVAMCQELSLQLTSRSKGSPHYLL